jgi:tripartite-type tricarboxylate transporter receptor subunit TctC
VLLNFAYNHREEGIMKTSSRQAATPQHRPRPRGSDRPHPKTPSSGQHPRRRFLGLAAGATALSVVSRIVRAQSYPARPITLIVPYAAGGGGDTIARIMSERMRVSLGRPVIIENVSGASGSIGASRVARAAPDGYTISFGSSATHVFNGALYPVQYDATKDFEPIALISSIPYLIVAKKAMPANDLREFIAWLKANPDKASQAHLGSGSLGYIAGVIFQRETGTRFQFVPYRGAAPAMQDLLAGEIDMTFIAGDTVLPLVRAGSVKAYAVLGKSRFAALPNIPTAEEGGVPGFYLSLWYALFAPKRTPQNIIAKLNTAVAEALADPGVRTRLADLGNEIFPRDQQTPESLRAFQKAEIEKWWPIINAAGIKPD